ncbi:hypothetical protein AJ80_02915 [Polytolypa hystricis UAMH7299]|uniref:Uncharacterized protein n=1 Tax=Polytolypa hystricis (strain UAMH7299) TaxID=1447883 RepID=A0A2B7YP84_POLH7|nr:hypothetical protein AJ80_02915 [Polytolypa hystricis UAMH7299]
MQYLKTLASVLAALSPIAVADDKPMGSEGYISMRNVRAIYQMPGAWEGYSLSDWATVWLAGSPGGSWPRGIE